MHDKRLKAIHIILFVLILIGLALLGTQKFWVSPFVNWILAQQNASATTSTMLPVSTTTSTAKKMPATKPRSVSPAPSSPTSMTPPAPGTGMLMGFVTLTSPCRGALIVGQPCNPTLQAYVAHTVLVYLADRSKLVATLTPDVHGRFSITLPVGTYVVDVPYTSTPPFAQGVPVTITLSSGAMVSVPITYSNGAQ